METVTSEYEKSYQRFIEAENAYIHCIQKGNTNSYEEIKMEYKDSRESFHLAIAKRIVCDKRFKNLKIEASCVYRLLNHLWYHYFQHYHTFRGDFWPDNTEESWQEIENDIKTYDGINQLINLLQSNDFEIPYTPTLAFKKGEKITFTSKEQLHSLVVGLKHSFLSDSHQEYIRHSKMILSNRNRNKHTVDIDFRREMSKDICDFLNVFCSSLDNQRVTNQHLKFIAEIYNLLKIPIYKRNTPTSGIFEPPHIHHDLNGYTFDNTKSNALFHIYSY